MKIRRAETSDFPFLVELQNQNMFEILSEKERQKGFLLAAFSSDDFSYMNEDLGVYVALDSAGKICGYLCANHLGPLEGGRQFLSRFLFMNNISQRCQEISYQGKKLTEYSSFVPSPICLDKNSRGSLIFFELCNAVLRAISPSYELAITLVSVNNFRSLNACLEISFEKVDRFYVGKNEFFLLICDLRKTNRKQMNLPG